MTWVPDSEDRENTEPWLAFTNSRESDSPKAEPRSPAAPFVDRNKPSWFHLSRNSSGRPGSESVILKFTLPPSAQESIETAPLRK